MPSFLLFLKVINTLVYLQCYVLLFLFYPKLVTIDLTYYGPKRKNIHNNLSAM